MSSTLCKKCWELRIGLASVLSNPFPRGLAHSTRDRLLHKLADTDNRPIPTTFFGQGSHLFVKAIAYLGPIYLFQFHFEALPCRQGDVDLIKLPSLHAIDLLIACLTQPIFALQGFMNDWVLKPVNDM